MHLSPPRSRGSRGGSDGSSSGGGGSPGGGPRLYGYKVAATFPHDPQAFTQGLEYDRVCSGAGGKQRCDDVLWESTGAHLRYRCRFLSAVAAAAAAAVTTPKFQHLVNLQDTTSRLLFEQTP